MNTSISGPIRSWPTTSSRIPGRIQSTPLRSPSSAKRQPNQWLRDPDWALVCKLANAFLAQRYAAVPESVVPADWNPKSFECAVNHVAMVRRGLGRFPEALALIGLIRLAIGRAAARGDEASLPCPAPDDDPEGRYRVVLRFGLPIIQRLADSGEWAWIESDRITIDPPAPG